MNSSRADEAARRIIADLWDDDPEMMTTLEADALCVAEEALRLQSYQKTANDMAERAARAEAERDEMRTSLAWYAEKAKAAARYLAENGDGKRNDAVMALVTELALDGGRRGQIREATENETEKPAIGAATPEGWDWQPIETAPRDGTRVYLAYDIGPNSWDWNFAPCRYHSVGWYLSPNGEIGNPIHFNPTHWAAVQRTAASR